MTLDALVGPEPPPTPRPPDASWRRPDGSLIRAWVVDLGKPHGARVDWELNGELMVAQWFEHPEQGREFLRIWQRTDGVAR